MNSKNKYTDSDIEFNVNDKVKEAFTNVSETDANTPENVYNKARLKNNLEDFAIYIADPDRLQN